MIFGWFYLDTLLQGQKWFNCFELFSADAFDLKELIDRVELAAQLVSFLDDGVSGFVADARELGELAGAGGVQVEELAGFLSSLLSSLLGKAGLIGHSFAGAKHTGGIDSERGMGNGHAGQCQGDSEQQTSDSFHGFHRN